ncbi:hypothetical protein Pst134EA_005354 [Puccinia striiformis f. sp. tritici]|uniref:hypothetical protein n=1 Tax=Puccinia striiformis f. sp. tritici TaxID=168172 RepID=UPI0020086F15|nr:hypothetical protein Pst134EA_005354 [Puccinia striiformis f. sp. tritici]KAH9471454.1 hypothetical protein Pst134EA_005354 [Puccinia striiformis f. sp. tritici]
MKQQKLPLLTANNFLEWKFKMEAVLDGLGMSTMLSGEKSRDAAGKFIADDPDLKIQAKALIAPLIHGSLISTVTANGGDKDVVKLWANIMSFGSSKKEANLFRAYRNLESIVINPNNLAGSILQYRDAIAELKSLDQSPDERQTAHMILGKIPDSLASIRDAIISTGLSSTVVTYEVVLDMIDNKAKSQPVAPVQSKPTHSTHRAENGESDAATALLAEFCKNKTHDPNASHSAAQCFALHPELLDAYRARLKARKARTVPRLTSLLWSPQWSVSHQPSPRSHSNNQIKTATTTTISPKSVFSS